MVGGEDLVQLTVGALPHPCMRGAKILRQPLTAQSLLFAVDGQFEGQPVGEHIVQSRDGAASRHVLDVDDLLLRLGERVGLEPAN